MCVCFLFQFLFIFYFEFWVLCCCQCPIWNYSIWASYYSVWASTSSLWSSWVFGVLNLLSPSIFRFYVSVFVLNNQASNLQRSKNLQQSKTSSSSLFSPNRLHRYDCPSINITLSLCMDFSKRLCDDGWVVDDKSGISCGLRILFSLQISNLIYDSSL